MIYSILNKIFFLLFKLVFLNALFYSDEYISDAFHNNGVLDFISRLLKSIYSFISTSLITNLLKILSSGKIELIKVIKQSKLPFRMDFLSSLVICALIACFRYLSIIKKKKYLYILINIINKFL